MANAIHANGDYDVREENVPADGGTRRYARQKNRVGNVTGNAPRDYEGDVPKVGGTLGLRSENVTKNQLRVIL